MYRTFNAQAVAFIRHCLAEELHTMYVSEYSKHEYSTYVTFMFASNNIFNFQNTYNHIALSVLHRTIGQTQTQENDLLRGPVYMTLYIYDIYLYIYIIIYVNIDNTFIYTYQYTDIKVKWLAAVNSLEPGECFQKFDVNINYLVNLLFKLTWYRVTFG